MSGRILFLGYGYTAAALAARLRAGGWRFAATARSDETVQKIRADGGEPVMWSGASLPAAVLEGVSAVLVSTPAGEAGCPAFAWASDAIASRAQEIKWIGYLSTNGVYGDHQGRVVDEDSRLHPTTPRARQRIQAESEWAIFGVERYLPVIIFRLPGIYGVGRSAFDAIRSGRAQRIFKEGQVFNRMHVDDIAVTLAASLADPAAGDLFNLADDEPAPPQDVIEFACGLMGVEPPPLIPFEEAEMSEMARSFYADNKRVSNERIKKALGVRLLYPTYREGLRTIWEGEKAQGASFV